MSSRKAALSTWKGGSLKWHQHLSASMSMPGQLQLPGQPSNTDGSVIGPGHHQRTNECHILCFDHGPTIRLVLRLVAGLPVSCRKIRLRREGDISSDLFSCTAGPICLPLPRILHCIIQSAIPSHRYSSILHSGFCSKIITSSGG